MKHSNYDGSGPAAPSKDGVKDVEEMKFSHGWEE